MSDGGPPGTPPQIGDVPLPPGYVVVGRLGAGGFATVWLAEQGQLGRRVAVKVLGETLSDSETERRFLAECRAIGSLSGHPAVVTVHDAGTTDAGRPYLVMEHLPGGSLQDRLGDGPLPWAEVVEVSVSVADALAAAHAAGILHRDVKPANVLLDAEGAPKLSDFGIARLSEGTQTATGTLVGTIPYTPPEVLSGDQPGPTADVWALGATMHALLAGTGPFQGHRDEPPAATIARVLRSEAPPLAPAVPAAVRDLVQRCLHPEPAARPQSAAEVVGALQGIQAARALPVTPARATRGPISGPVGGGEATVAGPVTPGPGAAPPTPPPTPPPPPPPPASPPPPPGAGSPPPPPPGAGDATVVDPIAADAVATAALAPVAPAPPPPPAPGGAGRRSRAPLLIAVAVLALVALVAVGVVVLLGGDDDEPDGATDAGGAADEGPSPSGPTGLDGQPLDLLAAPSAAPPARWSAAVPCAEGCSADASPEVGVVLSTAGELVAVDPGADDADAAVLWDADIDPGVGGRRVEVAEGLVLASAVVESGARRYATFSADDGAPLATFDVPDLPGAGVVRRPGLGLVVVRGGDPDDGTADGLDAGSTWVVDAATGQPAPPVPGHLVGLTDDLVVVSDGEQITALALDATTTEWTVPVATGAVPVAQGVPRAAVVGDVLVAVSGAEVVGLDLDSGDERWRTGLPAAAVPDDATGGVVPAAGPDAPLDRVVVSGAGGHVGLRADDGDLLWDRDGPLLVAGEVPTWVGRAGSSTLARPDGTVTTISTADGSVVTAGAVAGLEQWRVMDGQLLARTSEGVQGVDLGSLTEVWSVPGALRRAVPVPGGYLGVGDAMAERRGEG